MLLFAAVGTLLVASAASPHCRSCQLLPHLDGLPVLGREVRPLRDLLLNACNDGVLTTPACRAGETPSRWALLHAVRCVSRTTPDLSSIRHREPRASSAPSITCPGTCFLPPSGEACALVLHLPSMPAAGVHPTKSPPHQCPKGSRIQVAVADLSQHPTAASLKGPTPGALTLHDEGRPFAMIPPALHIPRHDCPHQGRPPQRRCVCRPCPHHPTGTGYPTWQFASTRVPTYRMRGYPARGASATCTHTTQRVYAFRPCTYPVPDCQSRGRP